MSQVFLVSSNDSVEQLKAILFSHLRYCTTEQIKSAISLFNSANAALQEVLTIGNSVFYNSCEPCQFKIDILKENLQIVNCKVYDFKSLLELTNLINNWVSLESKGIIQELKPPIDELTRLLFLNVLHFKSTWLHPFDIENTKEQSFQLSANQEVTAQFMSHWNCKFSFLSNDLYQMLVMPYSTEHLSMIFLRPSCEALEENFESSVEKLKSYVFNNLNLILHESKTSTTMHEFTRVAIPKFKVEHEIEYKVILQQMGITNAFEGKNAAFDAISHDKCLQLSSVFQKSVLEVNEQGASGAAASVAVARTRSLVMRKPSFILNCPFVFILRYLDSVVFVGAISNPNNL